MVARNVCLSAVLLLGPPQNLGGSDALQWFEIVWQKVEENHFDPNYGDVDWMEVRDRYRPLIAATEDDSAFYRIMNGMLFEHGLSHSGLIPPDGWPLVEPGLFAKGGIGIDVRILEGDCIVTAVSDHSPASEAGLVPGARLLTIDGNSIEQITADRLAFLEPPHHERGSVTLELLSRIKGEPGTEFPLSFIDRSGQVQWKRLRRDPIGATIPLGEALPPAVTRFEVEILDPGIAYIRFNWFSPFLTERLAVALDSLVARPGMIIDLRGNPGGIREVAQVVAGHFVHEPTLAARLKMRNGTIDVILSPKEPYYGGALVLLVDCLTKSAAEWFAATLQDLGRSVILGEATPGSIGPAETFRLPNGATLIFPGRRPPPPREGS